MNYELIFVTSPYTEVPVELNIGPDGTICYVPRHILPAEWSKTGLERRLHLPEIDKGTGHTLVHYLYTKDYEILNVVAESPSSGICTEFTQGLLVYIMTVKYNGLNDLQALAIEEMDHLGSKLSICEVVGAIKQHFSKLKSPSWIHDYVRKRVNKAFAEDHTIFRSTTFLEAVGNADCDRFLMGCVMDSYDRRLAYMAKVEKTLSEKLEQQILEARDTSVGDTVPEKNAMMPEGFILPRLDEGIKVHNDRGTSEQCNILTDAACTTGRSSFNYAASFSVEEAPAPAESCCSDISIVDYSEETSQAILHDNAVDEYPQPVLAESEREEKKVELTKIYGEGADNTAPERVVNLTEHGAVAEPMESEPEHVPKPGATLDWEPPTCSRQAKHLLEERLWKECKLCTAVLQKIAARLAQSS